ncbi:MAG: hypothetical protein B6I28_02945 [Fusobacteriia bacterium 4572_132]|nr:MAG: hypothetical protein B6I28_02945 [Fusobacteriia bacterium 4572_132]
MREFIKRVKFYEKTVADAKANDIEDIDFELAEEKILFLKNSYKLNINLIEEVNKEIEKLQKKLILNHRAEMIIKEISTFEKYLKEKYDYDLVLKDEDENEDENEEEMFFIKIDLSEEMLEAILQLK